MANDSKRMILTERSAPFEYIKESVKVDGKNYLGKLAGIGADFKNPTRNGRLYPLKLWQNVENSDDFKEGMATHTIFGENDHPEDRIDTSIKEISIVLTKYEIRENEGVVWTEFDILDTPQGRILKSILDYGSQIGVSSRGLGDEIVEGGETIIDPDTYVFYAWDAVVMPAVISARPSVVESANRSTLKESFAKEIENAQTKAELESIKKIAESTQLPELDSITESINNKLNDLSGKDISVKLESDLGILAKENEELKSKVENLEKKLEAKDIRLTETRDLLHSVKDNSRTMSKQLQKLKVSNASLTEQIYDETVYHSELCEQYEVRVNNLQESLSQEKSRNKKLSIKLENSNARKQEIKDNVYLLEDDYNKEIDSLVAKHEEDVALLESQITDLQNDLDDANNVISKLEKQKHLVESNTNTEFNKLKTQLQNAKTQNKETLMKYTELLCKQNGIKLETVQNRLPNNFNLSDVDRIVSELSDRNLRFSKLPIAQSRTKTVRLAESIGLSDEDAQTMDMLKGVQKTH